MLSPVHPKIQAAFDKMKSDILAQTTLYEVLHSICQNSGWGEKEGTILKSATANNFKQTIQTLIDTKNAEGIRVFFSACIEYLFKIGQPEFVSARKHFIQACNIIRADTRPGRLKKLIEALFTRHGYLEMLDSSPSTEVTEAATAESPDQATRS